jgi:CelD/BcsL family acetyltransferase involved in cellulose biosynthesis
MSTFTATDRDHIPTAPAARRVVAAQRWAVSLHHSMEEVAGDWSTLAEGGGATVFQQFPIISALYDTACQKQCGTPLIAVVAERTSDRPAAIFPLIEQRRGPARWLMLADCGVIDYGLPLFDRALVTETEAGEIISALAAAVSCDALYFNKMPEKIATGPNPFAGADVERLPLSCWHLPLGKVYETEIRSRQSKSYRKNNRRRTRQLAEAHDRRFEMFVGDEITPELLQSFFGLHEGYREARGRKTLNSECEWRPFYRQIVDRCSPEATPWIASLSADGEVIAMDFGLLDAHGPTPILTGMIGGKWDRYAPGLQAMEEYFAWFGARGYERCDLSIGDYTYKASFRAEQVPLYDQVVPVSLLGRGLHLAWRARAALRKSETLRKLLGKA